MIGFEFWYRRCYLYLLASIIIYSCNDLPKLDDQTVIPILSSDLSWSVDTIKLALPDQTREFPYRTWSHNYANPQLFAGFDERLHQINILNTSTMEYEKTLSLERSGPHGIPNSWGIGSIYYQGKDSIFILQNTPNMVFLLNDDSEIYWRLDAAELLKDNYPHTQAAGLFDMFYIYFYKGKIYFPLWKNPEFRDFTEPLIGRYNKDTEEFTALNIHYPTAYQNNDFGEYDHPGITFFRDEIYIVFPALPKIYVYDLQGNHIRTVDMSAELPKAQPLEAGEDARTHAAENPGYLNVQPLANGKYFVQEARELFLAPDKKKRKKYTILYNSDFSEYQIIDRQATPFTFGDEYLYFPIPPDTTDVQLLERVSIHE